MEIFADRAYHKDFTLVSRREEGAVILDLDLVAERIRKNGYYWESKRHLRAW